MRPRIGNSVIDRTRRDLGPGVLQRWVETSHIGRYARVRFACGVRLVRWCDCQAARKEPRRRR